MAKCCTMVSLVPRWRDNHIEFDLIHPTEWHVCCETTPCALSCLRSFAGYSVQCKTAHEPDERRDDRDAASGDKKWVIIH